MMSLTFKNVLLAIASIILIASCKKDKDDNHSGSYPKQVTIEYKVTSSSGLNVANVNFTNETGGESDLDNAPIPFSKKITRTVEKYDYSSLLGYSGSGGDLKLEILVNAKVVKTQTFSSTSSFAGSVNYVFP